ncbi:MAG: hypothetical protein ACOYMA_09170 [Bacteroidia bacterium]
MIQFIVKTTIIYFSNPSFLDVIVESTFYKRLVILTAFRICTVIDTFIIVFILPSAIVLLNNLPSLVYILKNEFIDGFKLLLELL